VKIYAESYKNFLKLATLLVIKDRLFYLDIG